MTPIAWSAPVEAICRLAGPTGWSFIVRAKLRNAVFKPTGRIFLRSGRFVGEILFEEPIGAEQQDGLIIMLGVAPEENAPAEVAG